mgnify:CR=1 FL=1
MNGNLRRTLPEDPRLADDPECVNDKPFKALFDSSTKGHMDGVVRTTIRTYVAEYFFKGYGLFSNLEINPGNYDQALFSYISKKMKQEMYQLGSSFATAGRVTIVREKYWYTFLEQCVEAYQRSVDAGEVSPPEAVYQALNSIGRGLDKYVSVNQDIKIGMHYRMKANNNEISIPPKNYDPYTEASQGAITMALQSVAFRLTVEEEEKENFFNGGVFTDFSKTDLFFSSIKKLRFFQKIYFIALYEKEATLIMSELIKQEVNRLSEIMVDGLSDKPRHKDILKSVFTMMPGSTSRVGLNEYYVEKNQDPFADSGSVPEVMGDNATPPIEPTDKPQFIVERYARIIDRTDSITPSAIRNRPQKYVGVIPLSSMEEFFSQNSDLFQDNYLSDFFGNLIFTYTGSIKALFDKGFTDDSWIDRLFTLNKGKVPLIVIKNARANHLAMRDYDDIEVVYDKSFLLPDETAEPTGTYGQTGVKYGLRLSIVFPKDYFSDDEITSISENSDFIALSKNEKSYLFDDGSFVLPLVSEEIDLMDSEFGNTNPFEGKEKYDLECMINKISERSDFRLFMENVFNLKQISSMLGIYCMETFMPSVGRKEAPSKDDDEENHNDYENYERKNGSTRNPESSWDGSINKSSKNVLRKYFKGLYLARTPDGQNVDDDDDDSLGLMGLFRGSNPFDFLTLGFGSLFKTAGINIPWWRKRMIKTKIYDANGQECADPKKDLQ